jgi:[ribosomal protein S5]-alanine N-acetyltransferase
LNWVIRLNDQTLAGYVQATARSDGTAYIAYELHSRYWRQGIATKAVTAVIDELSARYGAHTVIAVLKCDNYRSMAFLRKLGFSEASAAVADQHRDGTDESVMVRRVVA